MGIRSGPEPDPVPRDGDLPGRVSIEVEAVPVLSRPLARHGVPVVSRLVLTGGDVEVRGARVTVQLQTPDGPLGSPAELRADLTPGRTTVLAAVDLRLTADDLTDCAAPRPGTVEVIVEVDGAELARSTTGVQVLGAAQWLAAPAPLALELLAAHVLPDDPATAALVGGAADLLQQRTGDPTLADATCGPESIDRTAAAIVEAMRRRGVRHSEAPADWAATPLTVRTPGEVLESRLGSSLDTAVVLAAALEHAGIRPLLWIAQDGPGGRGHAFLGYWRTAGCADSSATTEVDGLVELVDRGVIQLVDSAMLTSDAEPATFGDLHRTPHAAWLTGDLHRIVGVTDVHRARLDGIRPLPVPGADPALRRSRQRPAHDDGWTRLALTLGTSPPPRVRQWIAQLRELEPDRAAGLPDDAAGPAVGLPGAAADLARHWATFTAANPLVAHLAADRAAPFSDPAPNITVDVDVDELAAQVPLPADAGQLRAVAEAAAGRTFVLDGPPGSGTTQTVANLAARAVADGARVLVLADDGPRLDALAHRLDEAGLGTLTRDLRAGAAVAGRDLRPRGDATSDTAPDVAPDVPPEDRLRAARQVLSDYAHRLHEPNSAGLSLYAAHAGMLPADRDAPALPVPERFVASTSAGTVEAIRRVLAAHPAPAGAAGPRPGHPWGFLDRPDVDPVAVQEAVVAVDRAVDALPADGPLASVLAAVRTTADLAALAAVLAALLDGPLVPLDVLDQLGSAEWSDAADAVLADAALLRGPGSPGLDVALPAALDLPLAELTAEADRATAAGRLLRTRRLSAVLDRLTPVLRPGTQLDPGAVPTLLAELSGVQTEARELAARAAAVPGIEVPPEWNPVADPDLVGRQISRLRGVGAAVASCPDTFSELRRHLAGEPAPDPVAARRVADLHTAVEALLAACTVPPAQLAAWVGADGLLGRWSATRAERAIETFGLPSLRAWRDVLRPLELLSAAGLTEARAALLTGAVPAGNAVAGFDRGLAAASVRERRRATGLDAAAAAAADGAARRFVDDSRAARTSVAAALRARLLPAEPPCVLADPGSVARHLPATAERFDLVVVDGSATLRVADAVGALGRSRATVVAGDSTQLLADDGDSLLGACLRVGLPRVRLTWQHRSCDETLVAVRNALSADGRLTTLPPPADRPAASLVRVAGTFHRSGMVPGTNPVEARAVVAEVRRRVDATAGGAPSVAVIALHRQQRTLIEGLLRDTDDTRLTAALDSADGIVVRTVDDVQGLDRDLVLLSLGCSPDARGAVPPDLGPLGRAGGERHLQTALTRARRQVVVYASFDPPQLCSATSSLPGVRQLRSYLDVAWRGTDAVPRDGRATSVTDPHREEIAAALRRRGLLVRTDVGLSDVRIDLTVARSGSPDAPVLAVLLDGPAWGRRETATDRDGVPGDVLGRVLGWPAVERVWLPAWLADPTGVLDRLVSAAESAAPAPELPVLPLPAAVDVPPVVPPPARPKPVRAHRPAAAPVRMTARPQVAPAVLAGEAPFRPWTPAPAGDPRVLRRLTDPDAARQVRAVLAAGIAAEGPVHRDRLARLTVAAFGATRVSEARRESVLALLPDPSAEQLWPPGLDPATWTGFRRQASAGDRALEHVAPQEVGNAMVALCRTGAGMTRDELFARTLAVFGHRRRHPVLVPFLEMALAQAVRASRVTRQPAGLLISAA